VQAKKSPAATGLVRKQAMTTSLFEKLASRKPQATDTIEHVLRSMVAQIVALPVRERDFLANQLDVFEYVGCLGSNRGGA